jgi:hypothetical protein
MDTFCLNIGEIDVALAGAEGLKDDPDALKSLLASTIPSLRPAPGYVEGYQATALALKANEAILAKQRIELQPDMYQLA